MQNWAAIFGGRADGSTGSGQYPLNNYSAKQFWGPSPNTTPTQGTNPLGGQNSNMKLSAKTLLIIGGVIIGLYAVWHWNFAR